MNPLDKKLTLPDLRFENSFLRLLQRYAGGSTEPQPGALSASELALLDESENALDISSEPQPIGPITPGIVTYAVIKDIMLRPLLEGFLWALIVMLFRPTLRLLTAQGHRAGTYVATMLGRLPARF